MQIKWMHAIAVVAVFAVPCFAAAQAPSAPAQPQSAPTKALAGTAVNSFDFSGSFLKTFSTSTTGNGTVETPTDSYGGMVGVRYIPGPWKGAEITYSYSPLNQTYSVDKASCGFQCKNPTVTIPNAQSQVTLNYVVSRRMGKVTPFAEAGFAFVINYSSGNAYAINTVVRPGYVGDAGADFGGPRFGLRVQFRDTLYRAPNLEFPYAATGKFMQTAEPLIGIYFRPW